VTTATRTCVRCGQPFESRKRGHIYCGPTCRHRGPRRSGDGPPVDEEQLARLFDPERDPDARVAANDWCAGLAPEFAALYAAETVGGRRRWYANLQAAGRI
jgi:hypothetical protein